MNEARGHMIATSPSGTATGKGGEIIVADDLQNPEMAESEVERSNGRGLVLYKSKFPCSMGLSREPNSLLGPNNSLLKLSRELSKKPRYQKAFCRARYALTARKSENSLHIPCLAGKFRRRRAVRSRLVHPPASQCELGALQIKDQSLVV
jgi:hypothetical protein